MNATRILKIGVWCAVLELDNTSDEESENEVSEDNEDEQKYTLKENLRLMQRDIEFQHLIRSLGWVDFR